MTSVSRSPPASAHQWNRAASVATSRAFAPEVACRGYGFTTSGTVVTLLLDLGTPPHVVKAIARHADLDVTLSIYAHTNPAAMREALDAIDWEVE